MTTINNIPSIQSPIVDLQTGFGTYPWIQFFTGLTAPAKPITLVIPTGSPFVYTASINGTLSVTGGTVSKITITRAFMTAPTGIIVGLIPLSQGDTATITYSVVPTLNFLPAPGIGSNRR